MINTVCHMKRSFRTRWCFLSLLCLICLTSASPAFALPKISIGTVRGFPANTVAVPLSLNYASNDLKNVVALQADVLFEQSGLVPGVPTAGSAMANHSLSTSLPGTGLRRILVYSPNNTVLSNGVIANLPFTLAPGDYRNYTLTLANVILAYADGTQAPVTVASGGIAVSPVYIRPDGNADFVLSVLADQPFSIQASTNLSDWVNLTDVVPTGPIYIQVDTDAHLYPYRFYRALPASPSGGNISVIGGSLTNTADPIWLSPHAPPR